MWVDELRELSEYLHDLVGAFSAGSHHDHIGLSLLGNCMLEHGLAAAERSRNESGAAFSDRIERVNAADSSLHDLLWPWFFLIGLDSDLNRPFLSHRDEMVLTICTSQHSDHHVDVVLASLCDFLHGIFPFE